MSSARLRQAFDELHFGPAHTLNLREQLPTAEQAVQRAEAWLRERQIARAGEVLVITGRGNQSEGGVSVVRQAVGRLLTSLKRRGVVTAVHEHTPGSFVVRLAPVSALFAGGQRKREPRQTVPRDPAVLAGLEPETRRLLRRLAQRVLESLGASHLDGRFVTDEMVRQFTVLAPGVPTGPDRELLLRSAIRLALSELDDDAAESDD
ncbi:MAG TPA: Smr/MutS family protein [Gemmatimonadaceae bacterium]|nr:Smr/MutS family protein [Gemmatimonadaceae bacterium]